MDEAPSALSGHTWSIKPATVIGTLLAVLCVFLYGCSQVPNVLNVFQPQPALPLQRDCPLPCYRGIIPGETTQEEALHLLQKDRDVTSITDENEFLVWMEENRIEGRLLIKEDAAAAISLHFPESTYTVGDLLAHVGDPDSLHITLPHPRHSPDPGDPQCDVLRLIYEKYDMEVVTYQRRTGEVRADHGVQRITLSPGRSQRAILTPYYRRDWQGVQSYCIPVQDIFQE